MTDYQNIATVLFDLDGTLIEHTRDLKDLCSETFYAFADRLAPLTQEQFWDNFWPKNHDLWYMVVDGVLTGDVARLYSFVNTLRVLNADENLAGPMLETWEGRIIAASRLFEDTQSTISRLRSAGISLGIVTNGFTTMQRRKLRHHDLEDQVDFVLISEEVGAFKPDQAIFDLALARAEVVAEEALFVGDTPATDIEGACHAGLRPVLMDAQDIWGDTRSDGIVRIRCLGELPPLLGLE